MNRVTTVAAATLIGVISLGALAGPAMAAEGGGDGNGTPATASTKSEGFGSSALQRFVDNTHPDSDPTQIGYDPELALVEAVAGEAASRAGHYLAEAGDRISTALQNVTVSEQAERWAQP
ncbi:hypothetical protein [Streptomyces sp. NPDC015131]|uniref:hypothetical protein n=1 Tax=Streptomyces sp. NPDC015131 TaxID=3364941 RepID=UPI0036F5C5CA